MHWEKLNHSEKFPPNILVLKKNKNKKKPSERSLREYRENIHRNCSHWNSILNADGHRGNHKNSGSCVSIHLPSPLVIWALAEHLMEHCWKLCSIKFPTILLSWAAWATELNNLLTASYAAFVGMIFWNYFTFNHKHKKRFFNRKFNLILTFYVKIYIVDKYKYRFILMKHILSIELVCLILFNCIILIYKNNFLAAIYKIWKGVENYNLH